MVSMIGTDLRHLPTAHVANAYRNAGLCVLPANRAEKRPALPRWKQYQKRLPTEEEISRWFESDCPTCLITGVVSGNLELIDFDFEGALFPAWSDMVKAEMPGLLDRLAIERSQSSGRHVAYRCEVAIPKNLKLAQRVFQAPDEQEVTIAGKRYRPRRVGDNYQVMGTQIETRGEGGLFLCHPTPGYEMEQGSFLDLPILTKTERHVLIEAALALNEVIPEVDMPAESADACGRPGDEFNDHGNVREVLVRHGWTCVKGGENEYWRRPGKNYGWSASLRDRVFYNFSNSADPFKEEHAYSPFAVYAWLEHNGDFKAAASQLRQDGFGEEPDCADVDLQRIVCKSAKQPESKERFPLVSCATLDGADYTPRTIIEDCLYASHPAIFGGLFKTCKTLVAVDAAIAVATGQPFLNTFAVPEPMGVVYFSGEGGPTMIQEYARRIADAKFVRLAEVDNLNWCFSIPRLEDVNDQKALCQVLSDTGAKVAFIDNLMLSMPGENAGNVMAMGQILGNVIRLCSERDVTPVFVHHFKRTRATADPHAPGDLIDLTQAGAAEIAGQWLLLTRRESYDPDQPGEHKLWLNIGGRLGHGRLHALDIHEGRHLDFNGRHWDVEIHRADGVRQEARKAQQVARDAARQTKAAADLEADRKAIIDVMVKLKEPETKSGLRARAPLGHGRFDRAFASLVGEGVIISAEVKKSNSQTYEGWTVQNGDLQSHRASSRLAR